MKYTLPALTLAISAALSGCATPHSSAVSQPVVDSPVPNVAQPLQRQLAEGLYEMALSPQVMRCTSPALKALKMYRAGRFTHWIRTPSIPSA